MKAAKGVLPGPATEALTQEELVRGRVVGEALPEEEEVQKTQVVMED